MTCTAPSVGSESGRTAPVVALNAAKLAREYVVVPLASRIWVNLPPANIVVPTCASAYTV